MLKIPEKLTPIITDLNSYRYFLLEGGRGGGKSQSIGRFLLYLAEHYSIRIVCGREIQNSINESVYLLLVDLIRSNNLAFEVFSTKIVHKFSGTTINFRGFREQGAVNIQGMEGVDIVWIDEAQAVTKLTLNTLIPTIVRNERAKIFFTMNRHVTDDPVFDFCKGREECLHISINYYDNPFCSNALKTEAEICKNKNLEDYNHIWLGHPLSKSEDAVFGHDELQACKTFKYPLRAGYGYRIAGFDIARFGDDKCAAVVLQQMGALHWEVIYVDQWNHRDAVYTQGKIAEVVRETKISSAIIDVDGLGGPYFDNISYGTKDLYFGFTNPPIGHDKNRFFGNNRTVNAYKLKDMILKGHIHITEDDMLKELETLRYKYDNFQRKILISKDIMKSKYNIKSPNMADALIMAVSLVGEVKQKQDNQYYRPINVSQDDNLFQLAGVM